MRALCAFGLLAVVVLPTSGIAQGGPEIGERVRVRHVDGRLFTGSVESTSDAGLRLVAPGGPYIIGRAEIAGMERSRGEHGSFGRGFITTVGIAAGGVGLISAIAWSPCRDGCIVHPNTRGDAFAWGAAGGALLGFPLGILVGIASKSERWEVIPSYGPVVLSFVAGPDGFALQASIPMH